MIQVNVKAPTYALVNNPVPVSISPINFLGVKIHMKIIHIENTIYEATYYILKNLTIDISDILQTIVSAPDEEMSYDISKQITEYRIKLFDHNSEQIFSGRYHAVWGGISKFFSRNLSVSDYINYKLANNAALSTRTSGKFIILRETEITPLKIIGSPDMHIQIISPANHIYTYPITPLSDTLAIHMLNIPKIRKYFFSTFDELPAYLSFIINGLLNFMLVFTPGSLSPNRYLLRFRNSLGCYEQLEITGKAELSTQSDSEEGLEYSIWDPNIMDYVASNQRKRGMTLITAETGFKTRDELMFMRDMLLSDDIYLIEPSGLKSKVLVSSEDFKIPMVLEEPTSVSLKIKFADSEDSYTPDMDNTIPESYPGEWILRRGYLNASGLIYENNTINTI